MNVENTNEQANAIASACSQGGDTAVEIPPCSHDLLDLAIERLETLYAQEIAWLYDDEGKPLVPAPDELQGAVVFGVLKALFCVKNFRITSQAQKTQ